MTFLTPEQFNHTLKPGPFTRWKNKLISLANPLLRHFQSHHPDVIITSTIVGRDASFAPPDQLGAPVVTNSTGLQAWILTPGESHTVLSELRTKGYPSSRLIAYVPAAGSRRVSLTTSRNTALGDSIDLTATATDVSVNLVFKESSTAPAMRDLDQLVIKTNFNVACRALIPASGGLLINCRNADPANHINYWLLLTPQLLDASGKPLRLQSSTNNAWHNF